MLNCSSSVIYQCFGWHLPGGGGFTGYFQTDRVFFTKTSQISGIFKMSVLDFKDTAFDYINIFAVKCASEK